MGFKKKARIWDAMENAVAEAVAEEKKSLEWSKYLEAENERLRAEIILLKKVDWEYECLWVWLDENTTLLNTIEPLMEGWKQEMKESEEE